MKLLKLFLIFFVATSTILAPPATTPYTYDRWVCPTPVMKLNHEKTNTTFQPAKHIIAIDAKEAEELKKTFHKHLHHESLSSLKQQSVQKLVEIFAKKTSTTILFESPNQTDNVFVEVYFTLNLDGLFVDTDACTIVKTFSQKDTLDEHLANMLKTVSIADGFMYSNRKNFAGLAGLMGIGGLLATPKILRSKLPSSYAPDSCMHGFAQEIFETMKKDFPLSDSEAFFYSATKKSSPLLPAPIEKIYDSTWHQVDVSFEIPATARLVFIEAGLKGTIAALAKAGKLISPVNDTRHKVILIPLSRLDTSELCKHGKVLSENNWKLLIINDTPQSYTQENFNPPNLYYRSQHLDKFVIKYENLFKRYDAKLVPWLFFGASITTKTTDSFYIFFRTKDFIRKDEFLYLWDEKKLDTPENTKQLILTLACLSQKEKLLVKNPYTILGLQANASEAEVKRVYMDLAKKEHPDKWSDERKQATREKLFGNKSSLTGQEKKQLDAFIAESFKPIGSAYEALCDPTKKALLDAFLTSATDKACAAYLESLNKRHGTEKPEDKSNKIFHDSAAAQSWVNSTVQAILSNTYGKFSENYSYEITDEEKAESDIYDLTKTVIVENAFSADLLDCINRAASPANNTNNSRNQERLLFMFASDLLVHPKILQENAEALNNNHWIVVILNNFKNPQDLSDTLVSCWTRPSDKKPYITQAIVIRTKCDYIGMQVCTKCTEENINDCSHSGGDIVTTTNTSEVLVFDEIKDTTTVNYTVVKLSNSLETNTAISLMIAALTEQYFEIGIQRKMANFQISSTRVETDHIKLRFFNRFKELKTKESFYAFETVQSKGIWAMGSATFAQFEELNKQNPGLNLQLHNGLTHKKLEALFYKKSTDSSKTNIILMWTTGLLELSKEDQLLLIKNGYFIFTLNEYGTLEEEMLTSITEKLSLTPTKAIYIENSFFSEEESNQFDIVFASAKKHIAQAKITHSETVPSYGVFFLSAHHYVSEMLPKLAQTLTEDPSQPDSPRRSPSLPDDEHKADSEEPTPHDTLGREDSAWSTRENAAEKFATDLINEIKRLLGEGASDIVKPANKALRPERLRQNLDAVTAHEWNTNKVGSELRLLFVPYDQLQMLKPYMSILNENNWQIVVVKNESINNNATRILEKINPKPLKLFVLMPNGKIDARLCLSKSSHEGMEPESFKSRQEAITWTARRAIQNWENSR